MGRKKTTEEFIGDARKVHGDKYDYSKVEYNDAKTPIVIICPKHGEFKQRPNDHLNGKGCKQCADEKSAIYRRKSLSQFITEARQIHGDKYDYSKTIYRGAHNQIMITCPLHGDFEMTPNSHLNGQGCPECGKKSKSQKLTLTTEEFIQRARKVHGDKYDYSKTVYKGQDEAVTIICPKHGEFEQTPHRHLYSQGCPHCLKERRSVSKRMTKEMFVEKAKKVHGDKYDYSLVDYQGCDGWVKIICPIHGVFEKQPSIHLYGQGCPQCSKENQRVKRTKTTEQFIENAREIHGNKYEYSLVNYINAKQPVNIICPKHGVFEMRPANHITGKQGCPECAMEIRALKKRKTLEKFIRDARQVHGEKYDYSKVVYVNSNTPVTIVCPIHGEFTQRPLDHLSNHGCPKCNQSKLEKEVEQALITHHIEMISQKTFEWLKYKASLYLDFYLPQYNVAIECQGLQHYEPRKFTKSPQKNEDIFRKTIERDKAKKRLCEEHGIKMLYFSHEKCATNAISSIEQLLKEIKA